MAVRGKYSDSEKKMLEEFEEDARTRQGWSKGARGMADMVPNSPVVTKEALIKYGFEQDPWNPFWSSEDYAIKSRWGGLIAHPWFLENYKPDERMLKTPKEFFRTFYLMGHVFKNYQPVRPGDTIRTWEIKPMLEDCTSSSGTGPREFRYIDGQSDMVNQKDEIIASFRQFVYVILHEGHEKMPKDKYLGDYGYTQQELDYIAELTEAEKPRGPEVLYWEDVNVGDRTQPIANGPTPFTTMNWSPFKAPTGKVEQRHFERYEEQTGGPLMFGYTPDKDGLLYPMQGGRHNSDRCAQYEGGPQAWLFNFVPKMQMIRLITNWIGDEGFVCEFGWRHMFRTPVGDTIIAHGEVIKKYVENDEHLVDLKIWCVDLRGCLTDMAFSTVKLVSRKSGYPGLKKVIKR